MSKKAPTPTAASQPKSKKGEEAPKAKKERTATPRIQNRRAYFDYEILDKIETGIELVGSEVKSVRKGHVQLGQSFARIREGQVTLMGCHIEEYVEANQMNHDPTRNRRLLLHRREIRKLALRIQKENGATLIPLEIYFKRGFAKVLLGLAKGKKQFDKRAAIKDRDDKRSLDRVLRRRDH